MFRTVATFQSLFKDGGDEEQPFAARDNHEASARSKNYLENAQHEDFQSMGSMARGSPNKEGCIEILRAFKASASLPHLSDMGVELQD